MKRVASINAETRIIMSFTPEVIGFIAPKDASHLMIFGLPLYVAETDIYSLCRRFGPLYRYSLIQRCRESTVKEEPVTSDLIDPHGQHSVPLPAPGLHVEGESEQAISQAFAHVHFY